ncbi:MAG TPA: hypothetical protein ENI99_12445 [Sedimenticola sp.]|nr:hypothetical protein [Sedimenticola sp.]
MSKSIQQKMHEQHVVWQRDHEAWLADIDQWKKQLQGILANLSEVEIALRDALDAIEAHADAVWDNQQRLRAHELAISEEARLGANKTDKEWAAAHSKQASRHERLAEAHERIKKHHHSVIAAAERLLNKISKPL